ncbi:hypothetical protein ABIF66_001083 [Bradyrhizobium japonicum]
MWNFHLRRVDAVLLRQRRPQPHRQITVGDADGLAVEVGQQVNAAAPARDDRVRRAIEQHEHGFDRRGIVLVAKADQLVDVDERELAVALGDARKRVHRSGCALEGHVETLGAEIAVLRREEERRHARIDGTIECEVDRCGRRSSFGRADVARSQRGERDCNGQQAAKDDRLECKHQSRRSRIVVVS